MHVQRKGQEMAKPRRSSPRQRESVEHALAKTMKALPELPREVFGEALSRITVPASVRRLWERLTPSQRKRLTPQQDSPLRPRQPWLLGVDLERALAEHGGPIGMWCHLNGVTPARAVLEIARRLSFLDEGTMEWLLHELGEEPEHTEPGSFPVWIKESGRLQYNGRTVRTVRIMKNRSNIQIILDVFQAAGWPRTIRNPIPGAEQQQLHQALRSLNDGLRRIRFRSIQGAGSIYWELA